MVDKSKFLPLLVWLLVSAQLAFTCGSRDINVQLTSEWPTSNYSSLIEASEFLSQEDDELLFWRFIEMQDIATSPSRIGGVFGGAIRSNIIENITSQVSRMVSSLTADLLGLSLAMRSFSPAVEMYRKLVMGTHMPCGESVTSWVDVSGRIVCTPTDLPAGIARLSGEELPAVPMSVPAPESFDHVFPGSGRGSAPTVVLYGLIGTSHCLQFHGELRRLAELGTIEYVFRHAPPQSGEKTVLQGFGVALDIKNMEYLTLDTDSASGPVASDSPRAGEAPKGAGDIEGLDFAKLAARRPKLQDGLRQLQEELRDEDGQDEAGAALNTTDLGLQAARVIMAADDPLMMLQDISQNFPQHARWLAGQRVGAPVRAAAAAQAAASSPGLQDVLLLNGRRTDARSPDLNVFSLLQQLRVELGQRGLLRALQLPVAVNDALLQLAADNSGGGGGGSGSMMPRSSYRIDVRRGSKKAVRFINNIEKDPAYGRYPQSLAAALQAGGWGLAKVRKNIFNLVLVIDPSSLKGLSLLSSASYLLQQRMVVRIGLVFSSTDQVAAVAASVHADEDKDEFDTERDAGAASATSIVGARSIGEATASDVARVFLFLQKSRGLDAATAFVFSLPRLAAKAAAEAGEGVDPYSVRLALDSVVAAAGAVAGGGVMSRGASEALAGEVRAMLKGREHRAGAAEMDAFVHVKGLPMDCVLMNGQLTESNNVQAWMQMMMLDQMEISRQLATGDVGERTNLYSHLLKGAGVYPRYHALLDEAAADMNVAPLSSDTARKLVSALRFAPCSAPSSGGSAGVDSVRSLSVVVLADLGTAHGLQLVRAGLQWLASDGSVRSRFSLVHAPPSSPSTGTAPLRGAGAGVAAVVSSVWRAVLEGEDAEGAAAAVPFAAAMVRQALASVQALRGSSGSGSGGGSGDGEVKELGRLRKLVLEEAEDLLSSPAARQRVATALEASEREGEGEGGADAGAMAEAAGLARAVAGAALDGGAGVVLANGRLVSVKPGADFHADDFTLLDQLEHDARASRVREIIDAVSFASMPTDKLTNGFRSDVVMCASSVVAALAAQPRTSFNASDPALAPPLLQFTSETRRGARGRLQLKQHRGWEDQLSVVAVLDPLSEAAQRMAPLLLTLRDDLKLSVTVVLRPALNVQDFPLHRFYRLMAGFDAALPTPADGQLRTPQGRRPAQQLLARAEFRDLPQEHVLTMKLETPAPWNVQALRAPADLDNLVAGSEGEGGGEGEGAVLEAEFTLKNMLLSGQCFDLATRRPPNGLQLQLTDTTRSTGTSTGNTTEGDGEEDAVGAVADTLVMQNLGYWQLKADAGLWSVRIAPGRGAVIFELVDVPPSLASGSSLPSERALGMASVRAIRVPVLSFADTTVTQLLARRRPGMDKVTLLRGDDDTGADAADVELQRRQEAGAAAAAAAVVVANQGSGAAEGAGGTGVEGTGDQSARRAVEEKVEEEVEAGGLWGQIGQLAALWAGSGDGVDVAAAAAGSGSELAVARGDSIEAAAETVHVFSLASGGLYERFLKIMMVSVSKHTSPVKFWLLENFLSPSFKESLPALQQHYGFEVGLVTYKWPEWLRQQSEKQRIIWGYKILFLDVLFPLDVKKIIYVDADQLVRADLRELWELDLHGKPYAYTPFCTSREETLGFQFWRSGYWHDHLRGLPYHISALYVVDLLLFRSKMVGDQLRAVYDQLSRDPNSLSNLDQDLPNFAQHSVPIHSLPQEWLWCESWCSDESKSASKTIDLCNNPLHKEPKLDMARRVIAGDLFDQSWDQLDTEIRAVEDAFRAEGLGRQQLPPPSSEQGSCSAGDDCEEAN